MTDADWFSAARIDAAEVRKLTPRSPSLSLFPFYAPSVPFSVVDTSASAAAKSASLAVGSCGIPVDHMGQPANRVRHAFAGSPGRWVPQTRSTALHQPWAFSPLPEIRSSVFWRDDEEKKKQTSKKSGDAAWRPDWAATRPNGRAGVRVIISERYAASNAVIFALFQAWRRCCACDSAHVAQWPDVRAASLAVAGRVGGERPAPLHVARHSRNVT